MKTVLSGIRPTGMLHLGNYFGAVKNFVKMQYENKCYFFIADYHSLTTHPTPENLHDNVKNVLIDYLAAGLDPEAATIYVQSDVPQVAELYLLLNMNAYKGELERCTAFKDKIRKSPDNINAGLLTYPTLMAADILIHRSDYVPVGKDQEQHLEMARTFARRFNRMYNTDFFPEPEAYNFGEKLIKIPGLDGSTKMGKSEGGSAPIFLCDDPKVIKKKVMKATTDGGPTEKNSPMVQSVQNLFDIMHVVSKEGIYNQFTDAYNDCTIRYGDFKKQIAEDICIYTEPLREKILELREKDDYLRDVLEHGKNKALVNAVDTISKTRELIGIKPF